MPMYYAIIAFDEQDSLSRRQTAREAHIARLQALHDAGRLLLAGPHPVTDTARQFTGSLIVAEFASLEAARAWADDDPYVHAGVYREVLVKPFRKVFPSETPSHEPPASGAGETTQQPGHQQATKNTPATREQRIHQALQEALQPSQLRVDDESRHHAGHQGNTSGGGHFAVHIVAECFQGKPALARHRMVYQALEALMRTDIHALRIDARSPAEAP